MNSRNFKKKDTITSNKMDMTNGSNEFRDSSNLDCSTDYFDNQFKSQESKRHKRDKSINDGSEDYDNILNLRVTPRDTAKGFGEGRQQENEDLNARASDI